MRMRLSGSLGDYYPKIFHKVAAKLVIVLSSMGYAFRALNPLARSAGAGVLVHVIVSAVWSHLEYLR